MQNPFSPFYRGGQSVQREADFPKLFSSNLPTRYRGLRECASSGRDSNPRPSGPKPDALARLRYRSIFGTFQPIGRGLSINHLKMRGARRGLLVAAFCFRAGAARHSPPRVFLKAGENSRFGRVNKGRKKIPNRAVRDFFAPLIYAPKTAVFPCFQENAGRRMAGGARPKAKCGN